MPQHFDVRFTVKGETFTFYADNGNYKLCEIQTNCLSHDLLHFLGYKKVWVEDKGKWNIENKKSKHFY